MAPLSNKYEYPNTQVAGHEPVLETGRLLWPETRRCDDGLPTLGSLPPVFPQLRNTALFLSMLTLKRGNVRSRNAEVGNQ